MPSNIFKSTLASMMEVPSEFICPITMEMMVHPLATRHGQNFERYAITAWLSKGSGECPLTRKSLTFSDLIHNNRLSMKINQWRELNGMPLCNDNTKEDDSSDDSDCSDEDDAKLMYMYGSAVVPKIPNAAVAGSSDYPKTSSRRRQVSTRRTARSIWNRLNVARHRAARSNGIAASA